MFKGTKYVRTLIDGEQIKNDGRNIFRVCSKRYFKGKPEKNIASGTTFDLQVMYDESQPAYDKNGNLMENNLYNINITFAKVCFFIGTLCSNSNVGEE